MNYNARKYNAQRYDINGVFYASTLTESVTGTDGAQLASLIKLLTDSMTLTDALSRSYDISLLDFSFLDDMIQIQFTNKALSDTIRLAEWFSIERNPQSSDWGD